MNIIDYSIPFQYKPSLRSGHIPGLSYLYSKWYVSLHHTLVLIFQAESLIFHKLLDFLHFTLAHFLLSWRHGSIDSGLEKIGIPRFMVVEKVHFRQTLFGAYFGTPF